MYDRERLSLRLSARCKGSVNGAILQCIEASEALGGSAYCTRLVSSDRMPEVTCTGDMTMLQKLSKLVVAVSILTFIPVSSSYAACSEQQSSAIITCLNTDNLPTCLAQNPGCNAQDVDTQITVQELDQRVLGLCCGKSSKGARLGCLNSSKNSLNTPAVKNLVPRAVITEVSADIANAIDSVKSSGICSNG